MVDVITACEQAVRSRERLVVDRISPCECGRCWWCKHGTQGRLIIGSHWLTDVTRGSSHAVRITEQSDIHPGELARPWLRTCLERAGRRRLRRSKESLGLLALRPPRYWSGEHREAEWAYVDLVSAYPSIYSRVGLDPVFRPADGIVGLGHVEALEAERLPRETHRVVGGAIRSTELRLWQHGQLVTQDATRWSRTLSPELWGLLMVALSGIAVEALRCGAIEWDTDGGILPADRADELIERIQTRWGLESRVRVAGRGKVWGVKHWQIGEVATLQPKRRVLPPERSLALAPPRTMTLLRLATGGHL